MSTENYGMLRQGFRAKNLAKIVQENRVLLKEYFGADVDVTGMNPLVKFDEVESRGVERAWVELGNLFNSGNLKDAEGQFLDDLALSMGKERKLAAKATTSLTFYKTSSSDANIPIGTRFDNQSTSSLKEFEVATDVLLPGVFTIQKGVDGGTDSINGYPGYTDFFNILTTGVEWVSPNKDGSSPWTGGAVDYSLVVSGVYTTGISWAPAPADPATNSIYYVKVGSYSAYVDVVAVLAGSASNAQINEIHHQQTPIAGIAKVTNDSTIRNGRDLESDLELRRRLVQGSFLLDNDEQMTAWLQQLHKVTSAKVVTDLYQDYRGHFRSLVHPLDENDLVAIYNQCLLETETRKAAGTNSVAIIRMVKGGAGAGIHDYFPSPYRQTDGVSGVWRIDWVNTRHNGTGTAYVSPGSFDPYLPYDNHISWVAAGPGAAQYFVKLVKAVEIAETFPLRVAAKLYLKQGYDLATVSAELFTTLNDHIKTTGVNGILYMADVFRIIMENEGVKYADALMLTLTCRIYRGGTADTSDILPINGSGFYDDRTALVNDVVWASLSKLGATPYTRSVDYLWIASATIQGARYIDWSPGAPGPEPPVNNPYWVKCYVKADITPPIDCLVILDGCDFTI